MIPDLPSSRRPDPSYIGGSDIVAIVGKNPRFSPFDVWATKCGYADPIAQTEPMQWGLLLQRPILLEYARRYEARDLVEMFDTLVRHPERPWHGGHPDGDRPDEKITPEVKTTGSHRADLYGEEGSDEVPDEVLIQATWYASLMGREAADVILLVGGQKLLVFRIPKNEKLETRLLELGHDFYTKHLKADVAPEKIPATDTSRSYFRRNFPVDVEPLRPATDDEVNLARQLARTEAEISALERKAGELENAIRLSIGNARGFESEECSVTNHKDKDGTKTDWKALAAHYQATLGLIAEAKIRNVRLARKAAGEAIADRARYESPKEGARKLLKKGRLFKEDE